MSTDTSLKPCPFCPDGTPRMLKPTCKLSTPYNPADRLYPIVSCDCGAEVAGENEDQKGTSAIEAWNRRTAPEPDGYIAAGDVEMIRRGGPIVPSVNVWSVSDPGDHPVWIGTPEAP